MMIHPVKFNRSIKCPKCDRDNTLDIYDNYDRPIFYDQYLKYGGMDFLKSKEMRYFKCKSCGAIFHIDFTKEYPIPLTYNGYQEFQDKFQST